MHKIFKLSYYQNYCNDLNQILLNDKDTPNTHCLSSLHAPHKSKMADSCHIEKSEKYQKPFDPLDDMYVYDMFPHKDVPYEVCNDIVLNFGVKCFKNLIQRAQKAFSNQMHKMLNFHTCKTTVVNQTKFCTVINTAKNSLWVVPSAPHKSKMADRTFLEKNEKLLYLSLCLIDLTTCTLYDVFQCMHIPCINIAPHFWVRCHQNPFWGHELAF